MTWPEQPARRAVLELRVLLGKLQALAAEGSRERYDGEGSVYRHGNGWEGAASIAGRRRTVRARTAREARERLAALRRRAEQGRLEVDQRLTVGEFLESWLEIVATTVRPSTHKRYREYVRVHAIPEIGLVRLVEIKPMHLQRLYATRLEAGSSPSTVQHLHATLHRALTMAERWEQVNRNVARQMRRRAVAAVMAMIGGPPLLA